MEKVALQKMQSCIHSNLEKGQNICTKETCCPVDR